jgi:hypothetical protein
MIASLCGLAAASWHDDSIWTGRQFAREAAMNNAPPAPPHSFREFYPQYLAEHANRTSRRLHFTGTSLTLPLVLLAIHTGNAWWILLAVLQAYALAWLGHFVFERNRPATFRHPLWSLAGDWRVWWDVLRGRVPL